MYSHLPNLRKLRKLYRYVVGQDHKISTKGILTPIEREINYIDRKVWKLRGVYLAKLVEPILNILCIF